MQVRHWGKDIDSRYKILSPTESRSVGWCVMYKDEFIGLFRSLERAHEFIGETMNNDAIRKEVETLLSEGECTLVYDEGNREYILRTGPRYYVHESDKDKLRWRVWDKSRQMAIAHFECGREAQLMADRYNNAKCDTDIKTYSRDPRSCPEADYRKDIQ